MNRDQYKGFNQNNFRPTSNNRFNVKGDFPQVSKKFDRLKSQDQKICKARAYNTDQQTAEEESESPKLQENETDVYDEAYFQGMDHDENDNDEVDIDKDPTSSYLQNVHLVQTPVKQHSQAPHKSTAQIINSTNEEPRMCLICNMEYYSNNKLHNHLRLLHPKPKKSNLTASTHLKQSQSALIKQINFTTTDCKKLSQFISSTATPNTTTPGYAFKGRHYAQVLLSPDSPQNESYVVCLDTGCGMSLIDGNFLQSLCPTIKINRMEKAMKVKGLGSRLYDASQFIEADFYMPTVNGLVAHFRREIHIVDNLDARILLGMDIASPEGWIIDLDSQLLTLPHNSGVQARIITIKKDKECKIPVFAASSCVIPAQSRSFVAVSSSKGNPLCVPQRDLVYEPL
ncbi:hypothetical protein OnM2_034062 [Erysiphe neolycopersici]|uniref:C2H2-type domain-containing protein n=1 Tax=Erysiphe neolycopersici TaxID=212602 RepID=A0A420HY28_9PEZI|nr:hypothetical protein OnM2_034062 [Erysiphe neolycopersici]